MKYFRLVCYLCFAFVSCSSNEDPMPATIDGLPEPVETPDPPTNSVATVMGSFTGYAHGLSGKAVIYTDDKNIRTLRLEQFNMTSGPDVYVFLSKSNNYSAANTVAVTILKGSYTNSNLSLTLDNSIDPATHKFVLVYCLQFSSLFGFAEPK